MPFNSMKYVDPEQKPAGMALRNTKKRHEKDQVTKNHN